MSQAKKEEKKEERKDPGFSMSYKMSSYERAMMIDGLVKGSRYNKVGREVLDSLVELHQPSGEESSVYNIVRLLGELRGDPEFLLQ